MQSQTGAQAAQTNAQANLAPANPRAANSTNTGAGLADRTGTTESAGLASNSVLNPLGSSAPDTATTSLKAEEDKTPELPGGCDTSQSDNYCVYTVQEGDNLSRIAGLFDLKANKDGDYAPHELLVYSNKPDIVDDEEILQPGQKIRVPLNNGVIHTILNADTLSEIADQFGVTVEDIASVNGMANVDNLGIGDELLIPSPTRFKPIVIVETPSAPSSGSGSGSSDSGSRTPGTAGGPRSNSGFIWPVRGPISSYYGSGHPLGIDIDLYNGGGVAIAATAGGVVTFAGGNVCCSYGLYVVIDHGNGMQTLYAHMSKVGVSVGQVVAQGQYVGSSGSTGYSTGEHLHFEVHVGGGIVNPLGYLP